MATSLAFYDDNAGSPGDVINAGNPLAFTFSGVASAEQVVWLVNDLAGAGADAATDRWMRVACRLNGTSDDYVSEGLPPVDDYYLEARIVSGYGTLTATATGYHPLGADGFLFLPASIASEEGVKLGIRANGPSGATTETYDFVLTIGGPDALSTRRGLSESCGSDGVLSGIGDYRPTGFWLISDVVENPGGADEDVQISDMVYSLATGTFARRRQLVTLNQNDSAAASLAAGESYGAILSAPATQDTAGSAGVTTTKGAKTSSFGDDDYPTLPTGQLEICRVRVDYGASGSVIEDADITNTYQRTGFPLVANASLTMTIGGGWARVDNALPRKFADLSATFPDDTSGLSLYLTRTGALSVESSPPPGSYKLRSGIVTASGSITDTGDDLREPVGHTPVEWPFAMSTLTAGAIAYVGVNATGRTVYLSPLRPVIATVDDAGSGNSTGVIVLDVEMALAGTMTWASIFPSSGTRDLRPEWTYSATDPRMPAAVDSALDPMPEWFEVPPGARLRVKIASETLDGTNPSGLRGVIRGGLG